MISFKILQTYLPTYIPNDDTFDQISCLLKEREIEREGRRMDELDGDEDEAGRGRAAAQRGSLSSKSLNRASRTVQ